MTSSSIKVYFLSGNNFWRGKCQWWAESELLINKCWNLAGLCFFPFSCLLMFTCETTGFLFPFLTWGVAVLSNLLQSLISYSSKISLYYRGISENNTFHLHFDNIFIVNLLAFQKRFNIRTTIIRFKFSLTNPVNRICKIVFKMDNYLLLLQQFFLNFFP